MSTTTYTTLDHNLLLKVRDLSKQVGNTPSHLIQKLFDHKRVRIYAKKEWLQISGSVKARAAYSIIRHAVENGSLHGGKILLDATSGNTGIAYASIGKALGIPVTLCLPENASQERKIILQKLGAKIIYTSRFEGTDGAQEVAQDIAASDPGKYYYADQYKNPFNWKAHYNGTALEIYASHPGATHFVAGLGTTGTFVGTGRRLKAIHPKTQLIGLQPDSAMHGLEGWKHLETARVPEIFDKNLADGILEISSEEAYAMIRDAYKHEGLLLSPSAAANLVGAIRVAKTLSEGTVVTVLPDNADKYQDVIKRLNL
jgi:cysteine synthase B